MTSLLKRHIFNVGEKYGGLCYRFMCRYYCVVYVLFFLAVPVVCYMPYIECYGQVLQCGSNMYSYWDIRREGVTVSLERSLWLWDPGSNISMAVIKVAAWCFWTGKVIEKKKTYHGLTETLWVKLCWKNCLSMTDFAWRQTRHDRGCWQRVF